MCIVFVFNGAHRSAEAGCPTREFAINIHPAVGIDRVAGAIALESLCSFHMNVGTFSTSPSHSTEPPHPPSKGE